MEPFQYKDGQLHAEYVPVAEIASKVGTPCYVYSQSSFERNWQLFDDAFSGREHQVRYSVKANSNIAVLAVLANMGSGFGVISGGELTRVLRAGGKSSSVVFSGVGKSEDEIRYALEQEILGINLESEGELHRVNQIASELGKVANVSVRVNPDIDAKTHRHITTGLRENKFGIPVDEACTVYRQAAELAHIHIAGIAMHIGSQITSLEPFASAVDRILNLVANLERDGIRIHHLDFGGGLGIRYRDEIPPTPEQYAKAIGEVFDRHQVTLPVSIDPGRAIAAESGILLSRVEYVKYGEVKNFAVVDAAMNDLIRPALYDAWMDIVPVQQADKSPLQTFDIVGPICETSDFLGKNRELNLQPGALIAVKSAGAYGAVMSSNYNSRGRPAEVLVKGRQFDVIREKETIEEVIAKEWIPARLSS